MSQNNTNQLPVVEEFYTLQGEGFYTGTAAYFVRLAGCDVGCHWCDSKPSWQSFPHQWIETQELAQRIVNNPSKHLVLTGGEPFLHDLTLLTSIIKKNGIITHIETSGTSNYSGDWDWISLSPKPWQPPLLEFYDKAHELKVIIQTPDDFKWAEECALKASKNCQLFLQPEWSVFNKITPIIVEYIKTHTQWRISIQSHKFMKIQ
ncbi:MAG: 7-carboxy-7-deazaguanine synthase QueE [Bacteroidales bacterium]|nr:7-carboxy-7-deazaguanine synthase QueE [Bacteroidales bacterium]